MNKNQLSVKTIVAIGIGAALFFVCGRFISIPSPLPNTTFNIQYGVLGFMATVFGPIAGLLIGLIGHTLIDASFGWGIWWSWVIASAIFGLLMGLTTKSINLDDGICGSKQLIQFNVGQVISHVICWIVVAPVLDILIYSEPASKVFAQGALACLFNCITTAIVGSILCVAYAKSRPQKGSLSKEA